MVQNKLAHEAMALHCQITQALLAEEAKSDWIGRPLGDPARIARLERLKCATADRWRRVMGYAPLYR